MVHYKFIPVYGLYCGLLFFSSSVTKPAITLTGLVVVRLVCAWIWCVTSGIRLFGLVWSVINWSSGDMLNLLYQHNPLLNTLSLSMCTLINFLFGSSIVKLFRASMLNFRVHMDKFSKRKVCHIILNSFKLSETLRCDMMDSFYRCPAWDCKFAGVVLLFLKNLWKFE